MIRAALVLAATLALHFPAAPVGAHVRLSGLATWYAAPVGTAAAGPALRAALGAHWRGRRVLACLAGTTRCLSLRLDDACACRLRHGQPTLVDLDARAFARLAPLARGVIAIEVRW